MAPSAALKQQWFDAISQGDVDHVSQNVAFMKGICNQWGETGLMVSAKKGKIAMVEILAPYESGATNIEGHTALMFAATANFPEICQILLPEEKHIVTLDSRNALMFAATAGSLDAAEVLICEFGKTRDTLGRAPLHFAVLSNSFRIVQLILQHPNDLSSDDISLLLSHSKQFGYDEISQMLAEYDPTARLIELDSIPLIKLNELQQVLRKLPATPHRSHATVLISEIIDAVTIDLEKKHSMISNYNTEIQMLHDRIAILNSTIRQQEKELDGLYKTVKLGISSAASKSSAPPAEFAIKRVQELMIKSGTESMHVRSDDKLESSASSSIAHPQIDTDPASSVDEKSIDNYITHNRASSEHTDVVQESAESLLDNFRAETKSENISFRKDSNEECLVENPLGVLSPDIETDEERQYLAYMALISEADQEHGLPPRTFERPPPHLELPRMRESIGTDEVDAIISGNAVTENMKGSLTNESDDHIHLIKEESDNTVTELEHQDPSPAAAEVVSVVLPPDNTIEETPLLSQNDVMQLSETKEDTAKLNDATSHSPSNSHSEELARHSTTPFIVNADGIDTDEFQNKLEMGENPFSMNVSVEDITKEEQLVSELLPQDPSTSAAPIDDKSSQGPNLADSYE